MAISASNEFRADHSGSTPLQPPSSPNPRRRMMVPMSEASDRVFDFFRDLSKQGVTGVTHVTPQPDNARSPLVTPVTEISAPLRVGVTNQEVHVTGVTQGFLTQEGQTVTPVTPVTCQNQQSQKSKNSENRAIPAPEHPSQSKVFFRVLTVLEQRCPDHVPEVHWQQAVLDAQRF